jgi:predicted DNA-binding transcriptional regulator AlpA
MKHSANPQTAPLPAAGGTHSDLAAHLGSVKQALLRPATACIYLGISRTGLHRLSENDPTFPRKIVLSRRCVGYSADSLAAWLAAKETGNSHV